MTRVRMILTSENGSDSSSRPVTVHNRLRMLDDLIKTCVASAGLGRATIVREMSPDVTAGVVTEPLILSGVTGSSETALDYAFDEARMRSVIPGTTVDIGSLNIMFPSTRWDSDGGGSAVVLSLALSKRLVESSAQISAPSGPRAAKTKRASPVPASNLAVNHEVDAVPGYFTIDGIRYSRKVRDVDGVPLREGDTVTDAEGHRWEFRDDVLSDTSIARVPLDRVRVLDGERVVFRPRFKKARPDYFRAGVRTLLVITPPESKEVAAVKRAKEVRLRATTFVGNASPEDWGWTISVPRPTVTHPKSICLGSHGSVLPHQSVERCIEAGGTWDRPCETDTECPYYDGRRARGGCRSGFCEMPAGVDRVSFREPAEVDDMMSHGCPPGSDSYPWCGGSNGPPNMARFLD